MTEKPKSEENKDTQAEVAEADRNVKRLVFDDSGMVSTYANVTNVFSTREEVTLLFGTNQAWHTEQQQLTVGLSNRLILNPFAAKRLSMLLNNVVTEYESRFGALPLEANAPEK